jgi:hypothetical protein
VVEVAVVMIGVVLLEGRVEVAVGMVARVAVGMLQAMAEEVEVVVSVVELSRMVATGIQEML